MRGRDSEGGRDRRNEGHGEIVGKGETEDGGEIGWE